MNIDKQLQKSITGVLAVTLKSAVLNYLTTWVIFTFAGVGVSVLPAIIVALSAVIRFVEPYWVGMLLSSFAGMSQKSALVGSVMAIVHFAVNYFADSTLYDLHTFACGPDPCRYDEVPDTHPTFLAMSVVSGLYVYGIQVPIPSSQKSLTRCRAPYLALCWCAAWRRRTSCCTTSGTRSLPPAAGCCAAHPTLTTRWRRRQPTSPSNSSPTEQRSRRMDAHQGVRALRVDRSHKGYI